mgnify:CR=1 FL=1
MSNPFNKYPTSELELISLCLKAALARRDDRITRTQAEEHILGTFELNGETHEVMYSVAVARPKKVSDSKFGRRLATVLAYAIARKALGAEFNGATEEEEKAVAKLAGSTIKDHGAFVGLDTDIDPEIEAIYKVRREETFPSTIPKGRTSFHGVDQVVAS